VLDTFFVSVVMLEVQTASSLSSSFSLATRSSHAAKSHTAHMHKHATPIAGPLIQSSLELMK